MRRGVHKTENKSSIFFKGEGFTLVETVVAVFLLMFAIVGPIGLAQRSLSSAFQAQNKITASYLAQDAIEFIKNARDTNIVDGRDWLSGLDSLCASSCTVDTSRTGDDYPEQAACPTSLCTGPVKFNASTNQYGHQAGALWQDTHFFRRVKISAKSLSESVVTATVSWDTSFGTESVTVTQNVFNPSGIIAFDPSLGLVAHLSFDAEGVTPIEDQTGNLNHGNIPGGDVLPVWTSAGVLGSAVVFDPNGGSRDRVLITQNASINMGDAFTVSFYIRGFDIDQSPGLFIPVVDKFAGAKGWMVVYRPSSASDGPQLEMRLDTDAAGQSKKGGIPSALDGTWHHVAWTVNNGTVTGYMDGGPITTSSYDPTGGFASPVDICLADNCGPAEEFDGSMDDFRLYNRALSPAEVLQLYQYAPPSGGLVGYWNFDEAGVIEKDRSGNGYDGTIEGMETRVPGKLPGSLAISLDGSTQYVSFPILSAPSQFHSESNTVAALVKFPVGGFIDCPCPPGNTPADIVDLNFHSSSGPDRRVNEMEIRWDSGVAELKLRYRYVAFLSGEVGRRIDSFDIDDLILTDWHYFVASYNKSTLTSKMYIDGQKVAEAVGQFAGDIPTSYATLGIGGRSTSVADLWTGLIDDVRIFNRALSDPEACTLYKQVTGALVC